MGNLNKAMFLGRMTRDPQVRSFASGGKVANFGIAVDNKRKDQNTGEWVNDPFFIDCAAFNTGNRKLADLVEQYLAKGKPVYVEGRLKTETWNDAATGAKRSATKLDVFDIQLIESRQQGQNSNQDNQPSQDNDAPPSQDQDDMGF